MPKLPPDAHEERRRLFRRMEWMFVYLPPILVVVLAGSGAAFLAWIFPLAGTTFLGRWAALAAFLIAAPLGLYLLREWWGKRK